MKATLMYLVKLRIASFTFKIVEADGLIEQLSHKTGAIFAFICSLVARVVS